MTPACSALGSTGMTPLDAGPADRIETNWALSKGFKLETADDLRVSCSCRFDIRLGEVFADEKQRFVCTLCQSIGEAIGKI